MIDVAKLREEAALDEAMHGKHVVVSRSWLRETLRSIERLQAEARAAEGMKDMLAQIGTLAPAPFNPTQFGGNVVAIAALQGDAR